MTVTPTSPSPEIGTLTAEAAISEAEADFDLEIPEEVPSADASSSRGAGRDSEGVGFTLDDFASLLSKYDYNFKPGDVVNGTVFALESKGEIGRAHV